MSKWKLVTYGVSQGSILGLLNVFIYHIHSGIECTLSKFVQFIWASWSVAWMKAKCKYLQLRWINPQYKLTVGWMDWKLPYGERLGESAAKKLDMSWQCAPVLKIIRGLSQVFNVERFREFSLERRRLQEHTFMAFQYVKRVYQKDRNDCQDL